MNLPHSLPELVLPAHCGTAAASELKSRLLALPDTDAPRIDAGAVETVGQAVLQLLLAARAERPALAFSSVSPAFAGSVQSCALGDALGLQALEPQA